MAGGRAAPRADRRWIEPSQEVFFPSSTRSLTFSPPGWQAVCTRGSPPGHLEGCLSFLSPPKTVHFLALGGRRLRLTDGQLRWLAANQMLAGQ